MTISFCINDEFKKLINFALREINFERRIEKQEEFTLSTFCYYLISHSEEFKKATINYKDKKIETLEERKDFFIPHFITVKCIENEYGKVKLIDAYRLYKHYCIDNNFKYCTVKHFNKEMREGYLTKRSTAGNFYIIGISFDDECEKLLDHWKNEKENG